MVGATHPKFHLPPHIPKEDVENGASRFYQWHFDAALYDIAPPRVGCLLAVRTPKGPDCTVRWEDEENSTMRIGPGATAYVTGSSALDLLPEDLKKVVMNSSILYAPKPFKWMSTAHSTPLGHTLATEGLEMPITEDLSDGSSIMYEKSKLKTYPMVWTNPKTGEMSLQVHGQAAWKLYLKDSPDGKLKIVDDLKEVRDFMDTIMRPAITPNNIYAHKHEEQDVVLWYNRALWHSIVSLRRQNED
jgi:hypothetical protein